LNKQLELKSDTPKWTDRQWQAITAGGQNILVAAAAGSGKTAVLVERIIRRITDENAAFDVDRLLVVTFTDAAAAEMRARIGEALEKELVKKPDSLTLKRQVTLLNKASISTFHSFCLSVLRRYYYLIDLDPAFRVADSTEIELLQEEVLAELLEKNYEQCSTGHGESFLRLADCYASDRSDVPLQRLVLKLYSFARSNPWPREWLAETAANYRVEAGAKSEDLPWVKDILKQASRKLTGLKALLAKAVAICQMPGGPTPYLANIQEELGQLDEIIKAGEKSWADLAQALAAAKFHKAGAVRGKDYDQFLKEQAAQLRNKAKNKVKELAAGLFSRPLAEYLADMRQMAPVMAELVKLLLDFDQAFQQAKKERSIIDYGDMEHYCLAILLDSASAYGSPVPSAAALEYRQKFLEVLVDEYQDTNMVQETIISLISGGPGQGNLFMVGDVKQSIYRFRLAEPELFLEKYKQFRQNSCQNAEQGAAGLLIDLAHNFRSRQEILAGTNYIFKQLMDEAVGEIAYDPAAELVYGAVDYPDTGVYPVELLVIDRQGAGANLAGGGMARAEWEETGEGEDEEQGEAIAQGEGENGLDSLAGPPDEDLPDLEELEVMELEARLLAEKIKDLTGANGSVPFQVYDRKHARVRPVNYRDIVILLRASKGWAPVILEELKRQGIPAYAELTTGYFEAAEVAVVMSLLQVIDNPYQDIPLAAVLRSPLVGLSGEQLAQIRLKEQKKSFYEAMSAYLSLGVKERNEEIFQKITAFSCRLRDWRTCSRQGSLADLIWQIYRETGYYDFVGAMPGGNQRQANLKALYHRARQYEATSFRGLFSFLRFVQRLKERGGDLGTARALGEQEDVVRVITIHKSKGLEFPVVLLAGMGKQFNTRDLHQRFLLHKKLGLGTKLVDAKKRVVLPTLLYLALKERLELELLAEEMRLLYVAMTRAKEKLFLIGTVKNFAVESAKWQSQLSCTSWLLPESERANCKSYLDWLGRALVRHRDTHTLRQPGEAEIFPAAYHHPSRWQATVVAAGALRPGEAVLNPVKEEIAAAIMNCRQVAGAGLFQEEVKRRLEWSYRHPRATMHMAKLTVSEIKRQWEANLLLEEEDGRSLDSLVERLAERPRFLQGKKLSQAEKGTAMHLVMQHLDLGQEISLANLENQVTAMVGREILTPEQAAIVQAEQVLQFLAGGLGRRLLAAVRVEREITFSLALPAREAILEWGAGSAEMEQVLVQGVLDCVFFEADGLVMLDYKTDAILGRYAGGFREAMPILKERYRLQMEMYGKAIEKIWQKPIKEKYLYFFDGGHLLKL
jgi:ATP-dependent helicase/nuclease subunit A